MGFGNCPEADCCVDMSRNIRRVESPSITTRTTGMRNIRCRERLARRVDARNGFEDIADNGLQTHAVC